MNPDIDLIMVDRCTPRMDGLEMVARCKANRRFERTPAIMITPEGHPEKIAECPAEWLEACLNKPLGPHELHRHVQRLFPDAPEQEGKPDSCAGWNRRVFPRAT